MAGPEMKQVPDCGQPERRSATAAAGGTRIQDQNLQELGRHRSMLQPPALIRKLAARTSLSATELAILEEYLAEPRTIARNRDIITVTQEQIGEILGLTGVHISRTLRRLRHEGLVAIEGHRVEINYFAALSALGDFESTYLRHFCMSDALLAAPAASATLIHPPGAS
jgi:hypothetical protein